MARSVLLFVFGLGLAGAVCEVIVRLVLPVSTLTYRYDEQVGFLLEPQTTARWASTDYDVAITTNSAGFHDVEHALAKPDGTYRILVLGDSMIEALQVPIAASFTHLLEQQLQASSGRPVEVINFGVSGNGPAQYYRLLEQRGLEYHPDLVVMAITAINDVRNSSPALEGDPLKPYYKMGADRSLTYIPPPAGANDGVKQALKRLARHSAAGRLVLERLSLLLAARGDASTAAAHQGSGTQRLPADSDWTVFLRSPPPAWASAYELTLRLIEAANESAVRHGAEFVVVVIPPKAVVENQFEAALGRDGIGGEAALAANWDVERPARLIADAGREHGFPVIDFLPAFREAYRATQVSASWPHDGHWNERGNALAAEVVAQWVRGRSSAQQPVVAGTH